MPVMQKPVQDERQKGQNDANLVFLSLSEKHGAILPSGSGLHGELRIPDFYSNQSQNFKLFGLKPDQVAPLLNDIVKKLDVALAKFDPTVSGRSQFVTSEVKYDKSHNELEFTLKLENKILLAKK